MKKKGNLILNLVLVLCAVIFIFAGWRLWGYLHEYSKGKKEYSQLRQYVHEKEQDEEEDQEKKAEDVCPIKVDFDKLLKINEDTVGWIYIENSPINYPIVHPSEEKEKEDYYLNHTFEKENNFGGAIFLDALCQGDFSSDNSIVYGHNLKNGEMFGSLKTMYDTDYNEKAEYDKYLTIWIVTPEEAKEYKVFCAREISARKNKEVYMVEFAKLEDFQDYLKQMKKYSLFRTSADLSDPESILTLSTCTSDTEDGRFVVQGVLVQTTAREP